MMNGMFVSSSPQESHKSNLANSDCHLPASVGGGDAVDGVDAGRGSSGSPDDHEKEERRRAAQKVLGKQG